MIGIIYCNESNMCPYLQKYIDSIESHKADYRVLLWNRTGEQKRYSDNYIVYNRKSDLYIPKRKKIFAFAGYANFLYREIRKQKFDKLILLTTLPAVICFPLLLGKFKKRYIYDFRDMSFEQIRGYRLIVEKIVEMSYFTSMSSPGYKSVIKGYSINSHNFRNCDLKHEATEIKPIGDKISLLHIGITRGEELNKRLADLFGNDERFEIKIIGTGNDTPSFLRYIKKFNNIIVGGTYDNAEKVQYIQECNGLLYYYPNSFNNNRALANKYYDGMIYKKPLIGNKNTYSGKRVKNRGLGISVDVADDDVPDKIYHYFRNFDKDAYEVNVRRELEKVIKEDKLYCEKIDQFVEMEYIINTNEHKENYR